MIDNGDRMIKEARSMKAVAKEMDDLSFEIGGVIGQAVVDIETIVDDWDQVSHAVGTADQWKAEDTMQDMQRKLVLVANRLVRGRRLLR